MPYFSLLHAVSLPVCPYLFPCSLRIYIFNISTPYQGYPTHANIVENYKCTRLTWCELCSLRHSRNSDVVFQEDAKNYRLFIHKDRILNAKIRKNRQTSSNACRFYTILSEIRLKYWLIPSIPSTICSIRIISYNSIR